MCRTTAGKVQLVRHQTLWKGVMISAWCLVRFRAANTMKGVVWLWVRVAP